MSCPRCHASTAAVCTEKGCHFLESGASSPATRRRPRKRLITIRLQKTLIADLKLVAKARGIPYQRLINEVLGREVATYTEGFP